MSTRVALLSSIATLALCAALAAQTPTPAGAPPPRRRNVAAARGAAPAQAATGIHIFIRAGLKSHGEGLHDYPQFLADWSKLLTERGAVVDGGLHSPDAAELATWT